jgi:tRNA (guanine10-N2)-dimethyltransferase
MHIAILGRQPALGIAELEQVFGGKNVKIFSPQTVTVECEFLDIQKLGGILKAGRIIMKTSNSRWSEINQKIVAHYTDKWSKYDGKITLGISVYDLIVNPRDIQKTGLIIKQKLKHSGASLRLIPNTDSALTTATSHHNKLGLSDNKVELIIVKSSDGKIIIAESTGSQNITAYAKRDQNRPKRDAFVGMLPPKLAQIMINLSGINYTGIATDNVTFNNPLESKSDQVPGPLSDLARSRIIKSDVSVGNLTILDPFCGTGVVLQEALIMGFRAYGTDLSEKMIEYSNANLKWLSETQNHQFNFKLEPGDATKFKWQQPIDAVVGETYLGQPFSAPPSPAKLNEVRDNCNNIITEFLKNINSQIKPGTPICIAIPAWRDKNGQFTHLPLIQTIARLGYKPHEFTNVSQNKLLYYREDQVVARELLVLTKV